MKSIRADLARKLGTAALLVFLVGGGGLYLSLRKALQRQFDDILVTKATALILAAEMDEEDLEIDLDVQTFAGFGTGVRGDYFAVFDHEGNLILRSPSLATEDLDPPPQFLELREGFAGIALPENVTGRAYWSTFEPPFEEELASDSPVPSLKLLVAGSDALLRRTLRTTASFATLFGMIGVALTFMISRSGVRSGLESLDRLSGEVERIDETSLARRVPLDGMPQELLGIGSKINELLARLEDSFGREKRFTSNAAHELRTPLAELRTMVELGTRWPDEFTEEHGTEMLEVISELEALLGTLALLARAEGGTVVKSEPVDLEEVVAEQVARFRPALEERGLKLGLEVEKGDFLTDPVLFRAVLQNLLENAVTYASAEGVIEVRVAPDFLRVSNETKDLEEDDIPQLFARFWRKSQSRGEKGHSGLGLSVVRTVAEHLGGRCHAELSGGRIQVSVEWASRFPTAPEAS